MNKYDVTVVNYVVATYEGQAMTVIAESLGIRLGRNDFKVTKCEPADNPNHQYFEVRVLIRGIEAKTRLQAIQSLRQRLNLGIDWNLVID